MLRCVVGRWCSRPTGNQDKTKIVKRGLFITLEGVDGSGKSTQLPLLVSYLESRGYQVCATREPGGTALGEQVRRILLTAPEARPQASGRRPRLEAVTPLAELALLYAARAQHLAEVVRPALTHGKIVVSDRFNDASLAYQGYGRKLGVATVRVFDRIVCGLTQPDLTIVLDIPAPLALSRALDRESRRNSRLSRFEKEGLNFQRRVRAGYLKIAQQAPRRVKVVEANRAADEVQADVRTLVDQVLKRWQVAADQTSKAKKSQMKTARVTWACAAVSERP